VETVEGVSRISGTLAAAAAGSWQQGQQAQAPEHG
jgi:hypothetical protein